MSDENNYLIPVEGLGLTNISQGGELSALTRSSDYLPQLRVMGSSVEIVKEGKFPVGHWGLYFTKDNVVDLTEQFDCLVIAYRPRAVILQATPINFYGKLESNEGGGQEWVFSEEFKSVQARAMNKEQSYQCGLEYLLWIPSVSKFGLFLMGNPTLRRESEKVLALVGKAATLKIRFIKTEKFSWHGCSCFPCTTPFANMPDSEEIKEQIHVLHNPEDSQVELADNKEEEVVR